MKILKQPVAPGLKVTVLDYLTIFFPGVLMLLACTVAGVYASYGTAGFGLGLFCFFIWAALIIAIGITPIDVNTYLVVQRFSAYRTVMYRGLGWVNPIFDRIRGEPGTLRVKGYRLFEDDAERSEVDFRDASATCYITAFYGIGHADDISSEKWAELTDAVRKYTYGYENPRKRAEAVLDGKLRPLLEAKTLEEAQRDKSVVCKQAASEASMMLEDIGLYQPQEGALIIEDIDLPDAVIALRELVLEGEKQADAETLRLQGPARAVIAARDLLNAGPDGDKMTLRETIAWLQTQQGLETIRNAGSNITFVGKDIPGLLNILNVGKGGTS